MIDPNQTSDGDLAPLRPTEPDAKALGAWSEREPLTFLLARLWAQHMPRGKGWVARWIGRNLAGSTRYAMRTKSGALLAVDPQNLDFYIALTVRDWEPSVLNTVKAVLRPRDVFYDIGANAGYLTIEAAAGAGGELDVRAFEPQPSLAQAAAVSAKLNGFSRVHVYEVLLGDRQSEVQFFVPAQGVHASLIARGPGDRPTAGSNRVQVHRRRMTTIDEQVANGSIPPPDVIKIDVEGAELIVFRGARKTIESAQPYIIFEADDNMRRFGNRLSDLMDCLSADVPYKFMLICDDGSLRGVGDASITNSVPFGNVLAVPPRHALPGLRRQC
jgi:FkbM family methyltransferase